MEAFDELKRQKLKGDKLQGKLDKSLNEINMIKAENNIKNDKSSTEYTVLKIEINNLKKEIKEKDTA